VPASCNGHWRLWISSGVGSLAANWQQRVKGGHGGRTLME
jgi:hypothetical protein